MRFRAALCAWGLASVLAVGGLAGIASAASPPVSVFPTPGTRYAEPHTQISFRGVAATQIGQITVVGSRSGPHHGTLAPDSDGDGASFLPNEPFTAGETVTVTTSLNVLGGTDGRFTFKICDPAGLIPYNRLQLAPAVRGGVRHYTSAPGLAPAAVEITVDKAPASQGDIFVAPQNGPRQNGPMILDPRGNLIWFLPFALGRNVVVDDFEVQRLGGQPVLTWWQGNASAGQGRGVGVIYNDHYQLVATVRAANGLDMDRHEFLVTNNGDAYFTAVWPVRVSFSKRALEDSVVQEVDIKTGLVLFEWDALDHIPIRQSYINKRTSGGRLYDPYHVNSISLDADGNLVVSMRNTSAVYKIDHRTGKIIWTLGGKASSFKLRKGVGTFYQHDATIHPGEKLTVFDDGGGPPRTERYSRGVKIALHLRSRTATLVSQYRHAPPLAADFEGSVQPLAGGDVFLGWGQQPYFSEDGPGGHQIYDAHFAEPTTSYRAFRFPWSAEPSATQIGVAITKRHKRIHLYASWNGATAVASWRALGGSSPALLAPIAIKAKRHFETEFVVHRSYPYYELQAINASGQLLGSSRVLSAPSS